MASPKKAGWLGFSKEEDLFAPATSNAALPLRANFLPFSLPPPLKRFPLCSLKYNNLEGKGRDSANESGGSNN